MKCLLKISLFLCLIFNCFSRGEAFCKADLIIFSFDRPLQLYALLESINKYVTGIDQTTVIYRVSNDNYNVAYQEVQQTFSTVVFVKQGDNPKYDFKPLTVKAFLSSPHEYIVFAVDDIIVKDYINIHECIQALKQHGAYGFYLRLGKNLSECYPLRCKQKVPPLIELPNNIYAWQFVRGEYDWRYPNTVDMTLYCKKDVASDIVTMPYYSPNTFEAAWNAHAQHIHKMGLCYEQTKIVNLPLNRVQNDCQNRHMNTFTPLELLTMFAKGLKMSIESLYNFDNKSAHMEYEPIFVARL